MSDQAPPNAAHGLDPLLSTEEVAAYLGVEVQTIHLWRHQGTAPEGTRIGKGLKFRKSAVESWLDKRFAKDAHKG